MLPFLKQNGLLEFVSFRNSSFYIVSHSSQSTDSKRKNSNRKAWRTYNILFIRSWCWCLANIFLGGIVLTL